ncbi:unnamed protein product, partial [Rotaria magnacalcarata]
SSQQWSTGAPVTQQYQNQLHSLMNSQIQPIGFSLPDSI